jgi:dihydroxy-acid dehydratase
MSRCHRRRFSGVGHGILIGHIRASGGGSPIAAVRDGDTVVIDPGPVLTRGSDDEPASMAWRAPTGRTVRPGSVRLKYIRLVCPRTTAASCDDGAIAEKATRTDEK